MVPVSGAKQALAWNLDEVPLQAVLARTPISELNCLWADSLYETCLLLGATFFNLEEGYATEIAVCAIILGLSPCNKKNFSFVGGKIAPKFLI